MHERHTIYRVRRRPPKWNLHPQFAPQRSNGSSDPHIITTPAHRDPPCQCRGHLRSEPAERGDPNSHRRTKTNGGLPQTAFRRHRGHSGRQRHAKRAIETRIRREHQTPRPFGAAIARPTKYSSQHTNQRHRSLVIISPEPPTKHKQRKEHYAQRKNKTR